MRGRGRCGRAARRRGDLCGLPLGRPGMAGLACLFALAPEQALGLQFARAAPVKSGPAVRDFVFESRLSSPSLNRGTWLGRKYVEARGWAALMPPYGGRVFVCSSGVGYSSTTLVVFLESDPLGMIFGPRSRSASTRYSCATMPTSRSWACARACASRSLAGRRTSWRVWATAQLRQGYKTFCLSTCELHRWDLCTKACPNSIKTSCTKLAP